MSFVSAIRDYVEVLNNLSTSFVNGVSFKEFIIQTCFFILNTLQYFFTWVITFQWIRDFTLLPISIPQNILAILKESFVLENPENVFFDFLEIPSLHSNSFILGFFNSLFLSLPCSVVHIITIRRLFIKGIPAAFFSIFGYLLGQWTFIISIICGFRLIVIPWLTLEPLNYIFGILLLFRLLYSMTQENLRELSGWNQKIYFNFFLTSFLLSWCEQSSIFQYLGNLTFNANTSLFETLYKPTVLGTIVNNSIYIVGIIIGSVFFTLCWGFSLLQLKNLFIRYTPLFLSSFIQTINTGSFILAISFSLSSIPFYGIDYLATSPFGFVSQDASFKNTIFDQYNIKDSTLGLGISSQFDSLDIDVSPFDRGRYLLFPERTMPFGFEDVNYRGEAEWTTRYDKVSTVTDSRAGFLSLAKIFKKQKSEETLIGTNSKSIEQKLLPIRSTFSTVSRNSDIISGLESKASRFEDWYTNDSNQSSEDTRPLESIFAELQDTTFPLDFTRTASVEPENIDLKLKSKYYSNPVYKNLLIADIDLFLNRQPKTFKLSSQDEIDLYTKRQILASYFNSLRDYSKLPYSSDFDNFFDGSKTFTNKIYNQQFKGTLRSLCRLFSLTIDDSSFSNENASLEMMNNSQELNSEKNNLVLKFDQPLYTFTKDKKYSSYHEEINQLTYSNPAFSTKNESLSGQVLNKKNDKMPYFLQDQLATPLYGGWDEKLRKFIITNKYLPRTLAGYGINIPSDLNKKFIKENTLKTQKIKFTVWPIRKLNSDKVTKPFNSLYVTQENFEASGDPRFDTLSTLPSNWETRNRRSNVGLGKTYENIFDYLAPKRGGFIWPGNEKLNLVNFTK